MLNPIDFTLSLSFSFLPILIFLFFKSMCGVVLSSAALTFSVDSCSWLNVLVVVPSVGTWVVGLAVVGAWVVGATVVGIWIVVSTGFLTNPLIASLTTLTALSISSWVDVLLKLLALFNAVSTLFQLSAVYSFLFNAATLFCTLLSSVLSTAYVSLSSRIISS